MAHILGPMRLRALLIAIILLAVAAAVVVIVLRRTDFDQYRSEIADLLSGTLGRKVQIHGPLALQIGLTPSIRVEEVTLANAPGQSPAEMAKIGQLWLELDLWQLLGGEIDLRDLRLRDAEILLEWSREGLPNWPSFGSAPRDDEQSGGPGFELRKLEIENLSLRLHHAASGSRRKAQFDRLSLARWGDAQKIEIRGAGEIDGVSFDLSGTTGTVANLVSGKSRFPIDLKGKLFDLEVEISGTAEGGEKRGDLDLRISASAPESAPVARRIGLQLPQLGPFLASGKVAIRGDVIRLSEVSLEVGPDDERGMKLTGELEGSFATGARPHLTAHLESPLIHLADVGLASPEEEDEEGIARPAAEPPESEALSFDRLRGLDADVSLRVDRVVGRGDLLAEEMDLTLKLAAGDLALGPVTLAFEGGSFTGSARIDAHSDPPMFSLALQGKGMHLGRALSQVQERPTATGSTDLSLRLESRGASFEALRAGLRGDASLVIREGQLYVKRMGLVAQDVFGNLYGSVRKGATNTARKIGGGSTSGDGSGEAADTKPIQCFASAFEIDAGVATARVLALDTGEAVMLGTGQIDLVQERYDIHIEPKLKQRSILAVTVPLDIQGPLNQPKVSPKLLGATKSTATGVLGNLTRPAAKLLPFGDAAQTDRRSCEDLREELSR
jgi:uncharacterized protein involved in outer membrane biogenesis